jgi:ATP-dependent RNA circularization protein (DNA/RNA ligase family)
LTKVSFHKEYTLVETENINLADLRNESVRMYYLVEIHDTDSDEIGCIMESVDGEMKPIKYDTFSQAKVQASLIKSTLSKTQYTYIVSFNG